MNSEKPRYDIVISEEAFSKIVKYKNELETKGITIAGLHFQRTLSEYGGDVKILTVAKFLEALMATKKPKIFTKKVITSRTKKQEWTPCEFGILGDINVTMDVEIYDNGVWNSKSKDFEVHKIPLNGMLLFTPGPLFVENTADYCEVVQNGCIQLNLYNKLIERRLLPIFYYIQKDSTMERPALVTVPGISCGIFAGKFKGQVEKYLKEALELLLEKHGKNLSYIKSVNFTFLNKKYPSSQKMIHDINFKVRPNGFPALENPVEYGTSEQEKLIFGKCKLYHIVAWDHLSLPGNNFFVGSRHTDDGVSAAATDSMYRLTEIKGFYVKSTGKYIPPKEHQTWEDLVKKHKMKLIVKENLKVFNPKGEIIYAH